MGKVIYPQNMPGGVRLLGENASVEGIWRGPISLQTAHQRLSEPGKVVIVTNSEQEEDRVKVWLGRRLYLTRFRGRTIRFHVDMGWDDLTLQALDVAYRNLVGRPRGERDPGSDLKRWVVPGSRVPEDVIFSCVAPRGDTDVEQRLTVDLVHARESLAERSPIFMELAGKDTLCEIAYRRSSFCFIVSAIDYMGKKQYTRTSPLELEETLQAGYACICEYAGLDAPSFDLTRWV
jgi:hypothetical protein